MIDALSNRITHVIKNHVDGLNEEKEEIINYGINLFIYEIFIILVIFIPSALLGILKSMIVMFIVYGLLRIFAGGAHARTRLICAITYFSLAYGTLFLANYLWSESFYPSIIVYALCFITIIKYAPGDTVEKPILSTKLKKRLKAISLFITAVFFVLAIIAWYFDRVIYNVIILSPISVMLLLTPFGYKLLKCQHSGDVKIKKAKVDKGGESLEKGAKSNF